jgi:hypothetical protein
MPVRVFAGPVEVFDPYAVTPHIRFSIQDQQTAAARGVSAPVTAAASKTQNHEYRHHGPSSKNRRTEERDGS